MLNFFSDVKKAFRICVNHQCVLSQHTYQTSKRSPKCRFSGVLLSQVRFQQQQQKKIVCRLVAQTVECNISHTLSYMLFLQHGRYFFLTLKRVRSVHFYGQAFHLRKHRQLVVHLRGRISAGYTDRVKAHGKRHVVPTNLFIYTFDEHLNAPERIVKVTKEV